MVGTKRSGFTLLEVVVATMLMLILVSIALPATQSVRSAIAVRNAKTIYATLHQRARARAIELGETVLFYVDAAGDSAWIQAPGVGVSDVTRFGRELRVDVRSSTLTDPYFQCMTPRGYADYYCGSAGGAITATSLSAIRLEFWQNADSTSVLVLPMGQLVGM